MKRVHNKKPVFHLVCMFLVGGAAAGMLKGRGALQDIDQMSLFRSVCKYCVSVTSVRDIVPSLKYAIQEAQSGTPGKCSAGNYIHLRCLKF
jgi:thiamine pyrophosphate-dependent acetolactate synthase large subunit-like protein